MLIEFGNEWILNQSDEFKVINSLKPQNLKQKMNTKTPKPKTKDEHCWYLVPCIKIEEKEDT
jgi:hypothetical protein